MVRKVKVHLITDHEGPEVETRYPMYRGLGRPWGSLTSKENLASTGIRSPDIPVRGESLYCLCCLGRKNIVAVTTCYELDGTGFVTNQRAKLPTPSGPVLGTLSLCYWYRIIPGVKWSRHCVNQPPPLSFEV